MPPRPVRKGHSRPVTARAFKGDALAHSISRINSGRPVYPSDYLAKALPLSAADEYPRFGLAPSQYAGGLSHSPRRLQFRRHLKGRQYKAHQSSHPLPRLCRRPRSSQALRHPRLRSGLDRRCHGRGRRAPAHRAPGAFQPFRPARPQPTAPSSRRPRTLPCRRGSSSCSPFGPKCDMRDMDVTCDQCHFSRDIGPFPIIVVFQRSHGSEVTMSLQCHVTSQKTAVSGLFPIT